MAETLSARDLYTAQASLEALESLPRPTYDEQAEAARVRGEVWDSQDALGGVVFRVPEARIKELSSKIEKMGKRCDKLGVAPPTFSDTGLRDDEEVHTRGSLTVHTWAYVIVGGTPPVLSGWTFLATLQHEEAGTIVRRVPHIHLYGEQRDDILSRLDLTQYRTAKPVCDHCQTRRVRRDTYIVVHESGKVRQVGSNCLGDFVGGLSPQAAAKGFEYIFRGIDTARRYQSEGFSGLTAEPSYKRMEFLAETAYVIRKYGWVSRAKSEEWGKQSTASIVRSRLDDTYRYEDEQDFPEDQDREFAQAALTYIEEMDGDNDYEYNLQTALAGEHIKVRSAGIAASGVGVYWLEQRRRQKAQEQPGLNEHFGQEKDRVQLTLCVKQIWENPSDYNPGGISYIHTMIDPEGRTFKWFGSYDLEIGKTYTGTWTVKGHSEWKGTKETRINRPDKLEEV